MQISLQHRVVGLYRTLALKIILLAVVFLVVPVILYRLNEIGDAQQSELLKHSVELQGNLITSVLQPYLERFDRESPETLQKALDGVVSEGASVKVLVRPGARQESEGFLYVAAAPAVAPDYLKQERESLVKLGVFDRLEPSCEGEDGRTLQFTNPAGKAEILTSLRSLHIGDNCWVIIATQGTQAVLSSALGGQPIWQSPTVHLAVLVYLLSAVIVGWLFVDIWRNLNRFRAVARSIRLDRAGGMSFREMNTIPELTGVADDFDALVAALKQSKNFILEAAEENAHALKAPLAVIAQAIEPLKRAIAPNPQARRSLELIERSTARLDALVSAARDLEQVAVEAIYPNLQRMNLSACLVQLVSAYEATLTVDGKNLRCDVRPDVYIYGTEEGIEAIVENLLENAASFTEPGGRVEVVLKVEDGDARLTVADDGPGVPQQDLPRIFQRHFSARPEAASRGNGVALADHHYGLGLWIARRNVEALTGNMEASNRQEGGFAVTVRFNAIA